MHVAASAARVAPTSAWRALRGSTRVVDGDSAALRALILAVDDDPAVGRAIERDLRHRYGSRHRVLLADPARRGSASSSRSSVAASRWRSWSSTSVCRHERGRVPGPGPASGPAGQAGAPDGVRGHRAAIRAINVLRLDHYLMKPWNRRKPGCTPCSTTSWRMEASSAARIAERAPAHWTPVLGRGARHPRLRGPQRCALPLARHRGPGGASAHAAAQVDDSVLPVLVFEDGETLVRPSQSAIAARIGLVRRRSSPSMTSSSSGGGPSGLAAAGLWRVRGPADAPGRAPCGRAGWWGQSTRIENYLGFPSGLSGADLARRATAQAQRLGAEMLTAREVLAIRENGPSRVVTLDGAGRSAAQPCSSRQGCTTPGSRPRGWSP